MTFEKENIDTLDSEGELMITIMSSLAQEESRSISENVTWGWRKRIADGKVSMTYGNFLDYERGADGTPVVDEAQVQIVRQIYGMFLDGQTPSSIAATLTQNDPLPRNGDQIARLAHAANIIFRNSCQSISFPPRRSQSTRSTVRGANSLIR